MASIPHGGRVMYKKPNNIEKYKPAEFKNRNSFFLFLFFLLTCTVVINKQTRKYKCRLVPVQFPAPHPARHTVRIYTCCSKFAFQFNQSRLPTPYVLSQGQTAWSSCYFFFCSSKRRLRSSFQSKLPLSYTYTLFA